MSSYARIVADIRQRIADGRLAPGDRVPSTREITREWGVAMATASKALAELRHADLVQPVPGVGTVVATARHTADAGLTRDRVVRAAIDIADAEGTASLSMRRVAADLGVATMSLYRYVRGKDHLLLLMADTVVGDDPLPRTAPSGWRARLELSTRLQWTIFRRHRWLAPLISLSRPQLLPNLVAHSEWALQALRELDLDRSTQLYVYITLFSYVRGIAVNLEPEAQAEQDTGMNADEWMQHQESALGELASSGRFPAFAAATSTEFDYDLDRLFEFGLARMLDGFDVLFTAPRALS